METLKTRGKVHWNKGRERALTVYRSHRTRRIVLGLVIAVIVFGLLGFFAAPPLIRSQIESRAGAALGRPVTLGGTCTVLKELTGESPPLNLLYQPALLNGQVCGNG